jgi:hypothetical protein
MPWDIEFTDEFEDWWNSLGSDEQDSVAGQHLDQLKRQATADQERK